MQLFSDILLEFMEVLCIVCVLNKYKHQVPHKEFP